MALTRPINNACSDSGHKFELSSITQAQSEQQARTGNQTLGGHKQNLVCTRTQKKGAVTPQETEPDLPVSVQESPAEAWVDSGLPWD